MNGIAACNLVAFAALLLVPPAAVRAADASPDAAAQRIKALQCDLDQSVQRRHGRDAYRQRRYRRGCLRR